VSRQLFRILLAGFGCCFGFVVLGSPSPLIRIIGAVFFGSILAFLVGVRRSHRLSETALRRANLRSLPLWAAAGFVVGFSWMMLLAVIVTLPKSDLVAFVFGLGCLLTFPAYWLAMWFPLLFLFTPLINALLYALVAFVWMKVKYHNEPRFFSIASHAPDNHRPRE
jgi:hypothetical protein